LLRWADKTFHVENDSMKFSKRLFSARGDIFSGGAYDILYDEEYGIAKTHIKKKGKLGSFTSEQEYLPHSKREFKLINLIYSFVRTGMFFYKLKKIKKFFSENDKILDVGCGTGEFLYYMKKKKYSVFGIEPNKNAREISFSNGINVYPRINQVKDIKFKAITLWHVLEHLPDPTDAVKMYYKMLDKDGILVIAVPNLESHDANYYKECWAAWDLPRHLWHFAPRGLLKLVQEEGFIKELIFPLWFDALYISYLSEKNSSNRFSFIRGILKGIYFNLKSIKTRKHSSLTFVFRKPLP